MIVKIDGIPVYDAIVDGEDTGMLKISLVDAPAVMTDFLAFSAEERRKVPQLYKVADEEKRLVFGVVMRADFPIYRRDKQQDGSEFEYYVIYKADTIRAMAEKYLLESRQNDVNLQHKDGSDVDGVQMVQYFIKDASKGLAPEGFDGIADGSLFAEFHVVNDDVWAAIKAGTYKGFSLEGVFDLVPDKDLEGVRQIVDALDGKFNKEQPIQAPKMSKLARLKAAITRILAEFGSVTTDKGVLAWDGDDDLKAGDRAYIVDEDGNRSEAADGEYTTEDRKVIVVADGIVAEIRDPQAEVAPEGEGSQEEQVVEAASVNTDKGALEWDGDEDLKAGDAVYVRDDNGERTTAPDGDYVTDDGKTIRVADGVVSEIVDERAEVEARRAERLAIVQKYEESYNEKTQRIADAVFATGVRDFYVIDAGDDFAVVAEWDEEYADHVYHYAVSWNEDGSANVADPVEVKQMWVPLDFVSPFESDAAAEVEALRQENETLKAEVAQLKATPAAPSAHEVVKASSEPRRTGVKGLDRLAAYMAK